MLWNRWWSLVCELQSACARTQTFLWMSLCLAGMTIRTDLRGVTSIGRALGLEPVCYDRLLDFFHSSALDLNKLTGAWCALVFRLDPGILRVNGRPVLVGDGIKVAKAGRKMPGVKKLHQPSESNNKAEYIFGHSCQAVAVLTQALSSVFALPLACRIHEGAVFSNRDQRTLLDKMILLLDSRGLKQPFYFVADAYYASGKVVRGLLARGNHLVTRVKSSSVAFFPAIPPPPNRPRPKGRPAKYGKKIKVAALLKQTGQLQKAPSPVYGEKGVILRFRAADLLWRPVGILVRFVVVLHPQRGAILLMCTDLTLSPLDIIRIYGLRFQDRSVFQAGPPCHRRLCLSLLDGGHDAPTARERQPVPAPQIGCLPHRRPPKDRSLPSPHPTRAHRPGNASNPLRDATQAGLAFLRLLNPHRSPGTGPLRTGRCRRPPQYPPGISRDCRQNLNPREIHPRPA